MDVVHNRKQRLSFLCIKLEAQGCQDTSVLFPIVISQMLLNLAYESWQESFPVICPPHIRFRDKLLLNVEVSFTSILDDMHENNFTHCPVSLSSSCVRLMQGLCQEIEN